MKNPNLLRRLRPFPAILGLSLLGVGSITLTAMANYRSTPLLMARFTTPQATVEELQQGKLKNIILVDVRSPEEYAEDRIGNSPLIPLTDIEAGFGIKQVENLVKTHTKLNQSAPTVVLYCHSGPRSIEAYQKLQNTGLKLIVLKGGITAWREVIPPSQDAAILAGMIIQ